MSGVKGVGKVVRVEEISGYEGARDSRVYKLTGITF